jgi:hypothetical protein
MAKKISGKICNLGYACDGCPYHRERNGKILCYKTFYEKRIVKKCSHAGCSEKGIVKGLCRNHYQQKRYKENAIVRDKFRQYVKKYYKTYRVKKKIEEPDYFTNKYRKWRMENPEKYAFNSARYYVRKLSPLMFEKLIEETKEYQKKRKRI